MKYEGLDHEFPDIEGASVWQERYAEKLREHYVKSNFVRFCELDEQEQKYIDKQIRGDIDENEPGFRTRFDDIEGCVWNVAKAGGIIACLKDWEEDHNEL